MGPHCQLCRQQIWGRLQPAKETRPVTQTGELAKGMVVGTGGG